MRVWITAWEWQCCGDPFRIGSEVTWDLLPASDVLKSELAKLGVEGTNEVTHSETHHKVDETPPPTTPTRGRVEAIDAVYCISEEIDRGSRMFEAVPGSGSLERREAADGWEPEDNPLAADRRIRTFEGYLVDLLSLD